MRYLVQTSKDIYKNPSTSLQDVLNECPQGYHLHSFQSYNEGGGYTGRWTVVFERNDDE